MCFLKEGSVAPHHVQGQGPTKSYTSQRSVYLCSESAKTAIHISPTVGVRSDKMVWVAVCFQHLSSRGAESSSLFPDRRPFLDALLNQVVTQTLHHYIALSRACWFVIEAEDKSAGCLLNAHASLVLHHGTRGLVRRTDGIHRPE